MSSNSVIRIEALGRDNYDTWKLQMRALLVKNDAWDYVSGVAVKPEPGNDNANAIREWKTKDEKALSDLILSISASQLNLVKNCTTSRELWQKLENTFQSKGPARKATLLKSLTLHKMSEGADVREHLQGFFDSVDKLADMDVNINPDQLAIMMLYSLPSSYENFRVAIESRDELPTPENLRTKIIEEYEARKNGATSSSSQGAMYVNKKKMKKPKENKKDKEEYKKEGSFKYKCYKCHEKGHKAADCPNDKQTGGKKKSNLSFLAVEEDTESCQAVSGNARDVWCLDSGCTSHLCKDVNVFKRIQERKTSGLRLANNASTDIKGKGVAEIVTWQDDEKCNVTLNNALHVPELRMNLLSVSKITDSGYRVIFEKEKAMVTDTEGATKLIANRVDNLYFVKGEPSEDCNSVKPVGEDREAPRASSSAQVWHQRMGHVNYHDLLSASKNGAVRGMDFEHVPEDKNCEVCLQGKMTRLPFPKESTRTTTKLELIHTDICGPMRTQSNGGSTYFITFIDDHTRWTEVRFLKSKGQALEEFKRFKTFVEKQHGVKIKSIQSDNGREYVNKEFDDFLKAEGIQRRLTTSYTPEQNGIAERKNRSLVETARCLMFQSGLKQSFWAEAISTANHIRNRCPTKKLKGRTPYEAWLGKVPSVKHFKVFGCRVFCLNKNPTKGKFQVRSQEGIFIGYSEESKAYRVWMPSSRTVEVTRDVKFLEDSVKAPETASQELDRSNEHHGQEWIDVEINTEDISEQPNRENDDFETPAESPFMTPVDSEDEGGFRGFPERAENDEDEIEEHVEPVQRRKRGRPSIIRTGKPGRPRKGYVEDEIEETESACTAEISLTKAVSGPHSMAWKEAMASEVRSLIKNNTWELVRRPKHSKVIGSRFVLRNKYKPDGSIEKPKARVVARGFSQVPGIDFHDTFAPVARLSSVRAAVAVAVEKDLKIRQLDITTAYLNGNVEEDIYMEMPDHLKEILELIVETEKENQFVRREAEKMLSRLRKFDAVCHLNKAIYGLRQAGRAWHKRLNEELRALGATPSEADPCVYRVGQDDRTCYVIVYVDDILVMSSSDTEIDQIIKRLGTKFDVKDLGDLRYCLGLQFSRGKNHMAVCQTKYIDDLLERFNMIDCNPVSTPLDPAVKLVREESHCQSDAPYRSLVGALMYLSVGTRPDIAHAVSHLSQFNECHGDSHWKAAKRVLRYLKGTRDIGLVYHRSRGPPEMYTDADWGNCVVDRKSYTGYVFMVSGGAVSWESKKQQTVALSSTEAEYMALSDATKEALYMKKLMKDFGVDLTTVIIKNDNNGAKLLAENPVFHARTKHVDLRHHFVRDAVGRKLVQVQHVPSERMTADILTKGLSSTNHKKCMKMLGLEHFHVPGADLTLQFEGKC